MANNSPTLVMASLSDDQLKKSIDSLVTHVDEAMKKMVQSTNNAVGEMEAKLKSLGNLKIDSNGTTDGGASKRAKAQNAETAAVKESTQAHKEKTLTLDQQASAINTAIQSEKKYTDEIRNQAAAIRATKEWQDKGHVVIGDINYYDKERANVSKRDKQLLLSLEEQIVQAQQNGAEAARRAAQETRNQAQAQQQVQQAALGTARIVESVHEMQRRSASFSKGNASIPTFTVELESAKRLSDRLKELREQYNNMNFGQRFSKEGQAVAQQIREITRQGQILNNQLNRPTKKEVFGLSEKTLDDIAYKMRQLASYRSGLNATTQTREISSVNDEYNRLKKRMDEVMQKNQQMIASNTALGRSWNYMKNRLAFYFTVGASTQFVKNLIEVRSQYEMNERALGILINSAERGTQIFNELSQMALVSPYTLIELSSAAKQLTAYDIAAKDVVNTTRRLADMAAAVGIPIERLTYALGQVKAYGYLNARDARMFANAGIPLVKNLSEYYTELEGRLVSTADIYDRIKKKQIGYEEVMSTISKMTDEGGKFFDFQAKMAETLKVQLANLTLAWNNMLNDMGEESQGVIVGGIGALKQMFLHWKDIEHILTEVVVTLGAYKAYQLMTTRLMGATSASLDAQILAMKRNNAAMLEKQALTRKLTVDELRQVAAQNQVTAADYRNALSGKNLTKQKALLLVALNKNNVQLRAAIVNMGLLTAREAANVTTGRALAIVFKSIGISIRNAAMAMKAFMVSNWWMLALGGIYELYHAWDSYNEHVAEINRSAAEHTKEAYENIKQYLEGDVISALQDNLAKGGKVSSDAEGQKAWDEMREKIELSSSASNTFIAKLMQINDINARLSAGFGYLDDIQRVAGVMQTLEKDAVDVSSTSLGGLFGEGLKDDLKDFVDSYERYVSLSENLKQNGVGEKYFNDIKDALEELRGEIDKTTNSIYDIASKEGFNTNEQREFFEREISEIAQAEQMGAKETRIFRMQAEKEYYAYARAQLVAQLEYQQGAQKAATERRIKDLDNEFGTNKALQESFFTWLTEKQDHAVKNMLRGKTQEEIKQGEWLKDSNAKWVEEMARKFSEEYNVSFDDLRKLVLQANTWSINIPVFFQTIGQPLSDVQRDYEARTGKKFSSNPLIKDAKTQVEILDILKKKQKEVANEKATAEKAGGKYWEDNKQRYEEENNALIADIHAYNALTDAEEKANKKSGKGGSKKDPLLDALKQEISLVEKLQGDYDKLTKSGASQAEALETIRGAYGKTIRLLNARLQSYGLPQIDISQLITGKDPNKALAHFKQTLETLVSKGMLTLERSKELEAVVDKFTLSAKTYNLDMITKGLNNELSKLKDEYELAVELDANPELGDIFADMMGLNKEQLSQMPKDFDSVVERLQKIIDNKLGAGKFNLIKNLNKASFDAWLEANKQGKPEDDALAKSLESIIDYANKVRLDSSKKQIEEWNKLLEKYAEYEYKVTQIQKEAEREREIARKKGASQEILDAINNREKQELARVSFEEFQKSPEWIVATGDLANMSKSAIGMLIEQLEKYKRSAKNLSPKQIKQLNSALGKLYKEQRKNNPFEAISNMLDEAKERMSTFDEDINKTQEEIDNLTKKKKGNIVDGIVDDETDNKLEKAIKRLKELKKAREETGKVDASSWVSSINETIGAVQSAIGVFDDLAKAIGGVNNSDLDKAFSVIDKAGQGAAIGAQIGGGWGALIGGVAGAATGLISIFAGAENERITDKIEESERAVKRLELAYIDLDHAVQQAYGMATIGANMAAKANKELQLVELKRQLALERSRDSKHRDEDKIIDLQKQIKELEYDIADTVDNIVNDLLGMSSVGDAMENMMDAFIEALRSGEDAMATFDENVDEMIANMVKKMFTTKILQPWFEEQWNKIQEQINQRAGDIPDKLAEIQSKTSIAKNADITNNDSLVEALRALGMPDDQIDRLNWYNEFGQYDWGIGSNARLKAAYEKMLKEAEKKEIEIQKELTTATMPTTDDIRQYAELLRSGQPIMEENMQEVANFLRELGLMKDTASDKSLSALQQGIQGITEDTAGALEAYMNGVSQQAYLRNDLLTQIRDTIMSFDMDIQLGVFSQMLLQLQNNYIVMQSMQSMMEGWTTPSGQGIRVELLS